MDYKKAAEELNNSVDIFKPELGTYNLVVVTEPEESIFIDGKGVPVDQIKMVVCFGGKKEDQKLWYVRKGITTQSLYGQLIVVGQEHGTLVGQTIELIVNKQTDKTGKTKKSYIVSEAIDILAKKDIGDVKSGVVTENVTGK